MHKRYDGSEEVQQRRTIRIDCNVLGNYVTRMIYFPGIDVNKSSSVATPKFTVVSQPSFDVS